MSPEERETSLAYSDADEQVLIYTCRRSDITALKKKIGNGVTLHSEGTHLDGTPWAQFQIPRSRFSISKCLTRELTLSPEERASRAKRLATARKSASEQAA